MKKLPVTLLVFAATFFGTQAYSQQADSLKQAKIKYIKKDLGVTDKNAQEVVLIMDQYKESAKQLLSDNNLTDEAKKIKFEQLIDNKNAKLKKVLTEQQLQKMVPDSER